MKWTIKHVMRGQKMSLLSNVLDGIVKISGENHIFSAPLTGDNLFVEVTGNIHLNARVQIENRATLIGNSLQFNRYGLSQ